MRLATALVRLAAPLLFLLASASLLAQDATRPFNPIARPAARPKLPDGAVRVSPPKPVSRDRVEAAIATVAQAWTDRQLDNVLSPKFNRRDELRDSMETKVPRDARLRVVAIQGFQVLEQYTKDGLLHTDLSVMVRTQLENNDPVNGFVSRDGTNEYHITITDRATP